MSEIDALVEHITDESATSVPINTYIKCLVTSSSTERDIYGNVVLGGEIAIPEEHEILLKSKENVVRVVLRLLQHPGCNGTPYVKAKIRDDAMHGLGIASMVYRAIKGTMEMPNILHQAYSICRGDIQTFVAHVAATLTHTFKYDYEKLDTYLTSISSTNWKAPAMSVFQKDIWAAMSTLQTSYKPTVCDDSAAQQYTISIHGNMGIGLLPADKCLIFTWLLFSDDKTYVDRSVSTLNRMDVDTRVIDAIIEYRINT
jgi:hypothetical protein